MFWRNKNAYSFFIYIYIYSVYASICTDLVKKKKKKITKALAPFLLYKGLKPNILGFCSQRIKWYILEA